MAVTFPRSPGFVPPFPARRQKPRRPLSIRVGKRLRRSVDALIEHSSLVSNAPVLDARDNVTLWTRNMNKVEDAHRLDAV